MGSDSDSLFHLFDDPEFADANLAGADSPENLFSILETLENGPEIPLQQKPLLSPKGDSNTALLSSQRSISSSTGLVDSDTDMEGYPSCKRLKTSKLTNSEEVAQDGHQRISHITVERNRRKQMNEHLSVLRSLMPCFYVKRGDQASIIGGVVEFIKELQQVLQSLEAKRQRKVYSEVLSPRHVSSPRPSPLSPRPPSLSPRISLPITPPLSPRPPPLSPRMNLPLSPTTPQSPYMPIMQQPSYLSTANATSLDSSTSSSSIDNVKDLAANSKSSVAQVQVKFSGPNLLLKTTSHRIPGQALKIITALENLSLEILHVDINTTDDTLVNSFTIKIGIECELSVEELTHEIQLTFC